jgi:hypothetical protein
VWNINEKKYQKIDAVPENQNLPESTEITAA